MSMKLALACALAASTAMAQSFEAPFRVKAQDGWVDSDVGHAAPYLYDIDGDGKRDLLVGQFGEGKMRIHRNLGTNAKPDFAPHAWFQAGGRVATTPAG